MTKRKSSTKRPIWKSSVCSTKVELIRFYEVRSNGKTLDRITLSEKDKVLGMMKVIRFSGMDTYERITEMTAEDEELKSALMNQYQIYLDLLPHQYGQFSEGLCLVKPDGKFGFIDRTGAVAFGFAFDNASNFIDGKAYVQVNNV